LPPADRTGTVLCGTYRLDEPLGDGPTGPTYRAWHLLLQRPLRVKLVRSPRPLEQDLVLSLCRDLRALNCLRPHGILPVELAFAPDGAPFLWAEFCEGQSLRQALRRGPLPVAAAGATVVALGRALREAHRLGLVHGNLCP